MNLTERLRAFHPDYEGESCWLINPDGPEAADRIERLETTLRTLEAAMARDMGAGYAGVALVQAILGDSK